MLPRECAVRKELPETFDLTVGDERKRLIKLGESIAVQKGLHFEGYIAYTGEPYSLEKARLILCFN
jgi:hypothetical protein